MAETTGQKKEDGRASGNSTHLDSTLRLPVRLFVRALSLPSSPVATFDRLDPETPLCIVRAVDAMRIASTGLHSSGRNNLARTRHLQWAWILRPSAPGVAAAASFAV